MKIKIVVLALGVACASPAAAATFSQFYAFGDSTLDSGWWSGALNGQCGAVAAPCTTGTVAKDARIAAAIANGGTGAPVGVGSMNTQILASYYGLTAIPANQPGGTNYAISGSLSVPVAGDGNLNANPNLPSTAGQIANYLGANVNIADPGALYLIGSGGNDITYARDNFGTLAARQAFLSGQAAALASAIQTLQTAGAHYILVNGVPGTGVLGTFFTSTLFADLAGLGVNFIGADIAGLVLAVQANPTLYGFTAATVLPGIDGPTTNSACVAGLGAIGWGQWCGNTTTPQPDFSHLRAADSQQTSFYSDDQHFSAAGQLLVANYEFNLLEQTLNSTPLPAAFPLFAAALGVIGLLARRRRD